jgi:hypothetical protein
VILVDVSSLKVPKKFQDREIVMVGCVWQGKAMGWAETFEVFGWTGSRLSIVLSETWDN